MPQPPDRRPPLLTVTQDSLVAVDFTSRGAPATSRTPGTPGTPRTPETPETPGSPETPETPRTPGSPETPGTPRTPSRNPYRRLFAHPGTLGFTIGNLIARLPVGMFSVSAVIMIAGSRGSYALAGAVIATGLVATGLVAPWIARLVDRHGQARIALPATAFAQLCGVALLLCVHYDAPDWTLFACYAAGVTTPNIGGMSRARWNHLFKNDPEALHTANAFEQAADELCFMLGPVLAAFLCGALFPEAGTLAGGILLMTGMVLFTAQRATEPPPSRGTRTASPLRAPGMPPLLLGLVATGAVFGSMEIVTIAFADAQGHKSAAGVVLSLQAAGSCAAGLLYGALKPAGPAEQRYPWCLTAMTAMMALPLLAALSTGSLAALAPALLLAGTATAPTMVTAMTLIQKRTPEGRLNEGMTLAVTGLMGGIACGSATGGWAAEHLPPATGFIVPPAAAALALLIATGHGTLTRRGSRSRAARL